MHLAQNLRYLRKKRNIKQVELAEALRISQASIGNWENDNRTPDIEMIVKLAEYFGVTLDELVLKDLRPPKPKHAGNIRFLREKNEITQKEMADLLGVSIVAYGHYESGKREISVDHLMKIADFFGVSLDQLTKEDLSEV